MLTDNDKELIMRALRFLSEDQRDLQDGGSGDDALDAQASALEAQVNDLLDRLETGMVVL